MVSKIETSEGNIITNQKEILNHTKVFYQNLYSKKLTENSESVQETLSALDFNILSDDDAEKLEGRNKIYRGLSFSQNYEK